MPANVVGSIFITLTSLARGVKVESFWSLWTHVHPPSSLLPTTDYLLFHSGVRRPVWEDPLNLSGGKWIIRLRKGVADRLWEDLVLAVIGDQFDGVINSGEAAGAQADANSDGEFPEICGCTISVRQNEDIISLWNRHDSSAKSKEKIKCVSRPGCYGTADSVCLTSRETIRRVLNLPLTTIMEYKSNNGTLIPSITCTVGTHLASRLDAGQVQLPGYPHRPCATLATVMT